MSEQEIRQFAVTHEATGIVTLVNSGRRLSGRDYLKAGTRAGLRFPVDCEVSVVRRGEEIPLPFDCIPLVLRRRSAS